MDVDEHTKVILYFDEGTFDNGTTIFREVARVDINFSLPVHAFLIVGRYWLGLPCCNFPSALRIFVDKRVYCSGCCDQLCLRLTQNLRSSKANVFLSCILVLYPSQSNGVWLLLVVGVVSPYFVGYPIHSHLGRSTLSFGSSRQR